MGTYHGPNEQPRRLYTPQQMADARTGWDAGRFSDEWREWRHLAAMQAGIVEPPTGTRWDNWGDDSPSQRAILIRAIRETPELLRNAITTAPWPTWGAVIEVLLRGRDETAREAEHDERDAEARRRAASIPRQDTAALRHILDRIAGS